MFVLVVVVVVVVVVVIITINNDLFAVNYHDYTTVHLSGKCEFLVCVIFQGMETMACIVA